MRGKRLELMLPSSEREKLDSSWARLTRDGAGVGSLPMLVPERAIVRVDFCALANVLPGAHLVMWAPAKWAAADLGAMTEDVSTKADSLSARESEVLALLAGGANLKEIAEALSLSPSTVKTHLRNAVQRLSARHRAHAVAIVLRTGAVDPLGSTIGGNCATARCEAVPNG
jgi:DNA-binding CsgD family transcriptional regulator